MNTDGALHGSIPGESNYRELLSKVPEVTIYFWIIKVLCTTVGETASDFLSIDLGFGLIVTSVVMGAFLAVALFMQMKAEKYIPALYWLAVVLISVFGTLVTDILTDSMNVPLEASTIVISMALGLTFIVWYAREGTLSIHSIFTRQREAFYWLAILFTFALGTAAGDLMAERLGLGYLVTGLIVAGCISVVVLAWNYGLNAVLSFWIAYILTRPLGASLGDYLSQSHENGGLGLGATGTSAVFILAIISVVVFLSLTKRDRIALSEANIDTEQTGGSAVWQVAVTILVLMIAAGGGYYWRSLQLQREAQRHASADAPLGDLSEFRQITKDTLALVVSGKLPEAKTRIADLEYAWDNAEGRLRAMNRDAWTEVDDSIDESLDRLRARRPEAPSCQSSLESLLLLLDGMDKRDSGLAHVAGSMSGTAISEKVK